jgi:AcrR family transcriptional regulator
VSNSRTDTRQQILDVAGDLFVHRGYAGTALTDIAERLHITKAALYYHFRSKAAILDALIAEPLQAYTRLAETAAAGKTAPDDLLAAVIDTTITARSLFELIGNDPSAKALMDATPTRATSEWINRTIVAALAGPDPAATAVVRAQAAYTVAKLATLNLLAEAEHGLDDAERAELLAAALRAYHA